MACVVWAVFLIHRSSGVEAGIFQHACDQAVHGDP